MTELGIVDIREIIRIIKKIYDVDFASFALTSFKYNLEKVMSISGLPNSETLLRKLSDEPGYFESFLNDLITPSTEMFRDPSLWRWLREDYFPKLPERSFDNFKIWLPQSVSGAELYTLCILLKEINLLDKVKIMATVYSEKSLNYIKSGNYPTKKIDVSTENYKRFQGQNSLDSYYTANNGEIKRDISLISNVEFIKDDINFNKAPQNVKLILFRNVMIYYNPTMQNTVLDLMHNSLSAAGCLIIGIKEAIRPSNSAAVWFEALNQNEGVYKRKL